MKSLRLYLSVFVVFALLFGAFSIPSAAVDSKSYTFYVGGHDSAFGNSVSTFKSGVSGGAYVEPDSPFYVNQNSYIFPYIDILSTDGSFLMEKGKKTHFKFGNYKIYYQLLFEQGDIAGVIKKFDSLAFVVNYVDGSVEYPDGNQFVTINSESGSITFEGDFTPKKDVVSIRIQGKYNFYNRIGSGALGGVLDYVDFMGQPFYADFKVQSEEAGLLSGLLNWVKGISDKVTNMFDSVTQGFANIGQWFAELPAKLWEAISNGLKGLFVPDEEYMTEYSEHWDTLLSQRFGALYEVSDIIYNFVGGITNSDKTNTIYMPLVSLESVGIPFSFGGYDIKIVPSGFEMIVEVIKKIISALCTFMFINSLRKRYDEIMGVEQ